jgi:hypothetical protein
MYADSGDFLSVHPHASASFQPASVNVEFRERIHNHLLDGPDVGDYVALPFSQIEDWITDDLAGPMVSNVAAAVAGMIVDSGARQYFFAREQILRVSVAAEGDDVRMLDDQKLLGDQMLFAPLDQISLDS